MSIQLHTVDNGNVQAINDGRLYGEITGNVGGIVNGSVVTSAGGLALHVTSGWGIGYGRVFTITADDYTVQPASSGTQKGRLYVHIDISQPANPIEIRSVAAASLPALIQQNLSEGGAIYEIELAHYDVTALAVSNLVSNSKITITPVPKSGGTFTGEITAKNGVTAINTNDAYTYARAANSGGDIRLVATTGGYRKLISYNAGGQDRTLVDVDSNNIVTYAAGTFDGNISAPNIPTIFDAICNQTVRNISNLAHNAAAGIYRGAVSGVTGWCTGIFVSQSDIGVFIGVDTSTAASRGKIITCIVGGDDTKTWKVIG